MLVNITVRQDTTLLKIEDEFESLFSTFLFVRNFEQKLSDMFKYFIIFLTLLYFIDSFIYIPFRYFKNINPPSAFPR